MGSRIVVTNIRSSIRRGDFDSETDINKAIDSVIDEINQERQGLISQFRLLDACSHEYKDPTFTIQGRVIGYVTVYERICKNCKHTETIQQNKDDKMPDWTIGATERYYNNDF